jgi:hypothetical protein
VPACEAGRAVAAAALRLGGGELAAAVPVKLDDMMRVNSDLFLGPCVSAVLTARHFGARGARRGKRMGAQKA